MLSRISDMKVKLRLVLMTSQQRIPIHDIYSWLDSQSLTQSVNLTNIYKLIQNHETRKLNDQF